MDSDERAKPGLRVALSSQLPRLAARLQVLPKSADREDVERLLNFVIKHWKHYRPDIQKLHTVSLSAFVSQIEEQCGANAALARDYALQDAKRRPRRPKIDQWIDKQLAMDGGAKAPALWQRAPTFITDDIAFDRFSKRVTDARKRRA